MEFIASCFVIFFSLIGFTFVVLCAALFCLSIVEDIREEKRRTKEFEKIVESNRL